MRELRDAAGVDWVVYEVQRNAALHGPELPEPLRNGWLCFESRNEKRRLSPIPAGWHDLPTPVLTQLLERATLVKRSPQNVP